MAAAFMILRGKRRKGQEEGGAPGADVPAVSTSNPPPNVSRPKRKRPGKNATDEEIRAYIDEDGDGNVTEEEFNKFLAARKEPGYGGVDWLPKRSEAAKFYKNHYVQMGVAMVILFNFFSIIVEKEIDPYPTEYQRFPMVWSMIDDVCNIIFIFELLTNLYGHFWYPFVSEAWNWLDVVVVAVGFVSLLRIDLGTFAQIKVLRAFRVLRLFKRIESLNKILVGLGRSIPGVLNAFVVMLIFMTIYAIVAVDLFRDFGHDGEYTTLQRYGESDGQFGPDCGLDGLACANGSARGGSTYFESESAIASITPRGFYYGQEYYGSFFRALYTLFQVLTGESWSEAVVRPLIFGWEPRNAFVVGIFFTSYILLTQVVLQNVVVAVLLDQFVADPEAEKKEKEKKEEEEKMMQMLRSAAGMSDPQALPPSTEPEPKAFSTSVAASAALPSSPTPSSFARGGGAPYIVTETPSQQAFDQLVRDQREMKLQLDKILSLLEGKALNA